MLLAFPTIGFPELMIFGAICLLLFGSRLPGAMRSLGQSVVQFKKGMNEPDEPARDDKLESPPKDEKAS